MIKLILASNSPRRRELLKKIAPEFETFPADTNESLPDGTPPQEAVKILARRKAENVYNRLSTAGMPENNAFIVLGSDTVVAYENRIFGKPKNERDAYDILRFLSGKTHCVYTGVSLVSGRGIRTEVDCSRVTFYNLSDEEIYGYIAGGSPMDKAGAYGIQDGFPVKRYEGSYTNIVGLPLELTEKMYKESVKDYEEVI